MKLYSEEEADTNLNGSAPEDEDETEEYDFSSLFDAPDYADFIKLAPNSKAKMYERKTASVLKAGLVMSLNNQHWPDAATFLKYGPGFATASGNLAAVDSRAAALIDFVTAPDSPYIMFALVAFPMIAQLARNHQPEMQKAGLSFRERRAMRKQEKLAGVRKESAPPITVRIFRREVTLPIRFRLKFPRLKNLVGAFFAPTQEPRQIAAEVLSDEGVRKALHKMGIDLRERRPNETA